MLIGSSNAVNITDGLDGLVIMPVIIAASILGLIAYFTGHIELSQHFDLDCIAVTGEITVFLTGLIGKFFIKAETCFGIVLLLF